jgi:hypothetical protein
MEFPKPDSPLKGCNAKYLDIMDGKRTLTRCNSLKRLSKESSLRCKVPYVIAYRF